MSTPEDRRTRHFYDADGNETATLDSAGYLVEYLRRSSRIPAAADRLLDADCGPILGCGHSRQLRPETSDDDIRSHFFHDGQGRQIGVLDAEGYFSETVYDVAGLVISTTRYDVALDYAEGTSTFATLRAEALAMPTESRIRRPSNTTVSAV